MMQRKIPTAVGILLVVVLVAALAVTTSLVGRVTRLFSWASQNLAPADVTVANITDRGFAVYWTTTSNVAATVNFGKTTELSDGVAFDDRDLSGKGGEYSTHFVRVTNLVPSTKYYFVISSAGKTLGDATKQGAPFVVTTSESPPKAAAKGPIFGKILEGNGEGASGVIVVWEVAGENKVAALSTFDGSYVLPVTGVADKTAETITFEGGSLGKATIDCQEGFDQPLPTIKLGDNVDCARAQSFDRPAEGGGLKTNLSEGETVSSSLPTISGKAGANQIVKIEVNSETPYSGTVRADSEGNWSWTPPSSLSPGQHTVTITIQNADGTTQTITRTFFVAAGEPILPITSGTPSATPPPIEPPPVEAPPIPSQPPVSGNTEITLAVLLLGAVFATLGMGILRSQKNG